MLYNPKWETETEVKPSLRGFMAWLRQQNPNKAFNFCSFEACACAQYSHHLGYTDFKWLQDRRFTSIHSTITYVMEHAGLTPRATFGELLKAMS